MDVRRISVIDIEQEAIIDAAPERVWEAIVEETSHWFHRDFYLGRTPRRFVIEPQVGGRVFEDWGDGDGLLWYTVTGVRKGAALYLAGDLFRDYGPGRLTTSFELEEMGESTIVRLSENVLGEVTETLEQGLSDGWRYLLNECLKPWIEDGAKIDTPETVEV